MRYGKLNFTDIANGTGVRVSLFVSGCRRRCKGCFNSDAWSFNYGEWYTVETYDKIIRALAPEYIAGLSILGGEPLEPENKHNIIDLCAWVKIHYPDKTIWLYTGYKYEDLKDDYILDVIDVLVDGEFIEAEKDISLKFRGSRNQRIIDVHASRLAGEVVLLEV